MNVALYHPFTHFAENYSLSHVVREQLLMLTEHGVKTHFITSEKFNDGVPKGVQVHAVLPYTNRKKIHKACNSLLSKASHVFVHDVLYLCAYADHASALRMVADEHRKIRWLHWNHSAPAGHRASFPNSTYIAMNYTDVPLVAEMFGVPEAVVRVVYNSVSPDLLFDWHPFTRHLVKTHNLLDCDVLVTYPLDTGRFDAKGGRKIIALVERMRGEAKDAKVVFVNAAANVKERRKLVKKLARKHVIFTSLEQNAKYEVSVPRRVVRELMQISNVFPLLSTSEGCSLTLLEAALTKNLVVLNEDFPPMREFGEVDHVLYMKVGSTRATTTYHPDEASYFRDQARLILATLDGDKALRFNRKVLRKFNREWIWRNQLEPLLS